MERKDSIMKGSISPGRQVWRRLKRNIPAMLSMVIILMVSFMALFCYLVIPDKTPDANRMCLPISNQPPGFRVIMLRFASNQAAPDKSLLSKIFSGTPSNEEWLAINGYLFVGNEIIVSEFSSDVQLHFNLADVVFSLNPEKPVTVQNGFLTFETADHKLHREDPDRLKALIEKKFIFKKKYLLGTDRFGRDLLSRLVAGSRITMLVGSIAVIISLVIGISLGAMAGFYRGKTDAFILWLINVTWSIPTLLLVIAITLVLGKGFSQVFIAVGLTMWVEVARLVRAQFFSLREAEYVTAARALGFSNLRIIARHILPNIAGPVLVVAASNFSASVLIESGLSFLGIGAQPPTPTWGTMIKENYGYIMMPHSAYLALLPGMAIMLVSMAFTFLANGLRDAMDSRQQISIV